MFNAQHIQINQLHRDRIQQQADQHRLAQMAQASSPSEARTPLLAQIGGKLVEVGNNLQARYDVPQLKTAGQH